MFPHGGLSVAEQCRAGMVNLHADQKFFKIITQRRQGAKTVQGFGKKWNSRYVAAQCRFGEKVAGTDRKNQHGRDGWRGKEGFEFRVSSFSRVRFKHHFRRVGHATIDLNMCKVSEREIKIPNQENFFDKLECQS
jgi:hypothetical protein